MTAASDWNRGIIDEFRANQGRVARFAATPLALVHHRGRKSGREYVSPALYLRSESDDNVIYIFATRGGSAQNPGWYYNLVEAGKAEVEVGTETFAVTVTEVTGAEHDRVFAAQAQRFPAFVDYERKTAGIRTIPVLMLRRT